LKRRAKLFLIFALLLLITLLLVVFEGSKTLQRSALESELFRLNSIATQRNLTLEDLSALGRLAANDQLLAEEFAELEWFVTRGYRLHAQHELEALSWLARAGAWECPAEKLSHVRPYLEHGETRLAIDAAEEGEAMLPAWEAKARVVKASNPDYYPALDGLVVAMQKTISAVRSGDYETAKAEAAFLEKNGYC
jgi:hypothetical protein